MTLLRRLYLNNNRLTKLSVGVFDNLASLLSLTLHNNHFVGLTENDPLFARLPDETVLQLDGQTETPGTPEPPSQAQTVNICDRTPQVRDEILRAIDASDCAAVTAGQLAAVNGLCFGNQPWGEDCRSSYSRGKIVSLKSGDFDGLTGLERLLLMDNQLTTLPANLFANLTSLQTLRLDHNLFTALPEGVFAGLTNLESLMLHSNQLTALPEGVFARLTGLASLDLASNRLATLPEGVFADLTNLQHLILVRNRLTALPEGVFGGLTRLRNLQLQGNHLVGLTQNDPLFAGLPSLVTLILEGQSEAPETPETPTTTATRLAAAVPLLVSASDSMRQGFVRIINESEESGSVRILAFDDAGNAANPVEIRLNANHEFHFNAGDLENGNANKGINAGVGSPSRGDWRLDVETALNVRVLSFIRTNDGFLTAMHDVLQRDAQGRLAAWTFNPARNTSRVSKLRLVNIGANAESVRIEGVDGQGNNAGPVSLTLAAGEARTLSAQDLENGAQGLTGMLDAGNGKWRLFITAEQSVVGMSLLDSASGHLSNISTMGNAIEGQ